MPDHKQSFFTTILAVLTALAALVGAIGGLIATIYATDGNNAASTPTPSLAVSSGTPSATATVTPPPTKTVRPGTPISVVIDVTPQADSWWGSPATSAGDDGDGHGDDEALALDWGCGPDSRGNGSKQDCGSGIVALRFDLSDLPDDVTVDAAVLTLYADEASDRAREVFARRVISEWAENSPNEPECDSSEETASEVAEDEWTFDVRSLAEDLHAGDKNLDLCIVLKDANALTFVSREGVRSRTPVLTITYH